MIRPLIDENIPERMAGTAAHELLVHPDSARRRRDCALLPDGARRHAHHAKWVRTTGWIWAGGPEGTRNVLATIAGSVSLTLASSQFGPRLLRTFLNDRWTQIVLGIFVSTFLYCLLVLRTIRGTDAATFVPFLSVTVGLLFAVTSVAFDIFFVHHVSNAILADNLIARVAAELREGIDRLYPDEVGVGEKDLAERKGRDLPPRFDAEALTISSKVSGYISAIPDHGTIFAPLDRAAQAKG